MLRLPHVLFAAALAVAGGDPPASPAPLTAAREARDAGAVPEGDPLTASFTLTNRSAGAVRIGAVEAGCSCQTAEGLPKMLAAGATATLKVTMKTRDRVGRQRGWWAVNYAAAGGEKGRLVLSLTATVTAAGKLEPTPPVAQFGAAELGEEVSAAVVLAERAPGGGDVKILRAEGPDWLSVKVQRAAGDGPPRFRLRLSGTPPAVPGRAGGAVRVTTDHPRYPSVEVPFEAFVRGRAEVTPRSLVQIVGGSSPRPATLTVRGRNGAAVTGVSAALFARTDGGEPAGDPAPLPAGAVVERDGAWRLTLPPATQDGPRTERFTLRLTVAAGPDAEPETHHLPLLVLRPSAAPAAATAAR